MTLWIAVGLVGLGSYLLRVVPLLLPDRIEPSGRARPALERATIAAVTTLVMTSVAHAGATGDAVASLTALATGGAASARGRSFLFVIVAGCVAYAAVALVLAGRGG